jgi:hypothetical protein
MAYKRGADGVVKKGKTEGKNLGNDGPTVGIQKGNSTSSSKGGKTTANMKAMGRGLAKVKNQKGG